jgi:polyribonucleotide nucleotidyltransferase
MTNVAHAALRPHAATHQPDQAFCDAARISTLETMRILDADFREMFYEVKKTFSIGAFIAKFPPKKGEVHERNLAEHLRDPTQVSTMLKVSQMMKSGESFLVDARTVEGNVVSQDCTKRPRSV